MGRALGAVHTAPLGAVAVVQDLGWPADEQRPLLSLENEGRHGGRILAEVHDQGLARLQGDGLPGGILLLDDDGAMLHFLFLLGSDGSGHPFPDIGLDRLEGQVLALIDLGAGGRKDLSGEFRVHFRLGKLLGCGVAGQFPGVILLAVEDGGMLDRTGDAGRPMLRIRPEALGGAIGIGKLQDTPERALLALEVFAVGDNLVRPPARGHLRGEDILFPCLQDEGVSDVIGEGTLGLGIMRETRFQDFLADQPAVHIQVVNPQAGRHPDRLGHFLSVLHGRQEPAGAVGGPVSILVRNHAGRRVDDGNPLGDVPGRCFQRIGALPDGFGTDLRPTGRKHDGDGRQEDASRFHIDSFISRLPSGRAPRAGQYGTDPSECPSGATGRGLSRRPRGRSSQARRPGRREGSHHSG